MASRVQCTGKKAYPNPLIANKALDTIWKAAVRGQVRKRFETDGGLPCRVYKCAECSKWHLTSLARKTKADWQKEKAPK